MACSWAFLFSACARCLAFFFAFLRIEPMIRSPIGGSGYARAIAQAARIDAIISSESSLPRPGSRRPGGEQCALPDGNAVAVCYMGIDQGICNARRNGPF